MRSILPKGESRKRRSIAVRAIACVLVALLALPLRGVQCEPERDRWHGRLSGIHCERLALRRVRARKHRLTHHNCEGWRHLHRDHHLVEFELRQDDRRRRRLRAHKRRRQLHVRDTRHARRGHRRVGRDRRHVDTAHHRLHDPLRLIHHEEETGDDASGDSPAGTASSAAADFHNADLGCGWERRGRFS